MSAAQGRPKQARVPSGDRPRLAAGEPVTSVAMDLGYENPAAFTLMFKRAFGSPPLTYLGLRGGEQRSAA